MHHVDSLTVIVRGPAYLQRQFTHLENLPISLRLGGERRGAERARQGGSPGDRLVSQSTLERYVGAKLPPGMRVNPLSHKGKHVPLDT
jgi:hypothetical protein